MSDSPAPVPRRKLIEVALPLETINRESAREKSIRHGHPSTLHLWWARRPLAAARAVLFAQLVDDPSSHPDKFPTEEDQARERKRLHALIEELVVWENAGNEKLLKAAHEEILKSTDGNPPPILDPFAGGGTIPLEAQRLGLEAHASDLNPVAVLINKALIEIPPKFAGQPPVHPDAPKSDHWPRATGLAEDVRRYGQWMRDEAEKRIGHLYPKVKLGDGTDATVIAWIWTRTVTCPNPACGIRMPLVRSWWLGKRKGREAYVVPRVVDGKVQFTIGRNIKCGPGKDEDGTVSRTGAICVGCGAAVNREHIKHEGVAGRLGVQLMATVAEHRRSRVYLEPSEAQEDLAMVTRPDEVPSQEMAYDPRNIWVPPYGLTSFADLFSSRQLTMLCTFSDLVSEVRERIAIDGQGAGKTISSGVSSEEYAVAVSTYLGLCASKMAVFHCTLARWRADADKSAPAFGRQAIAMTWDYAEVTPFSGAGGDWSGVVQGAADAIAKNAGHGRGAVKHSSAQAASFSGVLSTDPPYYDNIEYANLSDFSYVWLRRSLKSLYPDLLATMLTPKSDELVANPYRHGGPDSARAFFESGFREVFSRVRDEANTAFPMTVYYAFKQSESDVMGEASKGWETLLHGMIRSGWAVTSTWPLRTEMATRMVGRNTNALASSIVLSLRPRSHDASIIDRRGFVANLHRDLPDALRKLQQGAIAPVDLPQAAIGPGMATYSQYAQVLEDDGSSMTVRDALARINEVLDEVLAEQEGDFDTDTRFAIAWFRQHGFDAGDFGSADSLARARNSSVQRLARLGILRSGGGSVQLLRPDELSETFEPGPHDTVTAWEFVLRLAHAVTTEGIPGMAKVMAYADRVGNADTAKELGFLLFSIAEDRKLTEVAVMFNALVTAWNEAATQVQLAPAGPLQAAFDFDTES
ncbi:DUF1156 domain-containing protein [Kineococcus sp. SYSU DK002]|uniref:DUF1156 domain-containing protein n=1 Tax=Kineococcus sp. SYSU DK002 TaxID=3383123 RepID=UPI003D7D584D